MQKGLARSSAEHMDYLEKSSDRLVKRMDLEFADSDRNPFPTISKPRANNIWPGRRRCVNVRRTCRSGFVRRLKIISRCKRFCRPVV